MFTKLLLVMLNPACLPLTAYAAPPYCVVTITTDPPKGPHSHGATVKLQCRVTPPPPERAIYSLTDSIPSTYILVIGLIVGYILSQCHSTTISGTVSRPSLELFDLLHLSTAVQD